LSFNLYIVHTIDTIRNFFLFSQFFKKYLKSGLKNGIKYVQISFCAQQRDKTVVFLQGFLREIERFYGPQGEKVFTDPIINFEPRVNGRLPPSGGTCLAVLFAFGGEEWQCGKVVDQVLTPRTHVATRLARTCQVRRSWFVLLPQEIFRAITAGRNERSAQLFVGSADNS